MVTYVVGSEVRGLEDRVGTWAESGSGGAFEPGLGRRMGLGHGEMGPPSSGPLALLPGDMSKHKNAVITGSWDPSRFHGRGAGTGPGYLHLNKLHE